MKLIKRGLIAFVVIGLLATGWMRAFAYDTDEIERTRIENNRAVGDSYLLFNNYTYDTSLSGGSNEHFAGSSTSSGGSTSVSDGYINTENLPGTKYLTVNVTSVTGTATFTLYGFTGTSTIPASPNGTRNAHLIWEKDYTSATTTTQTISNYYRGMALATENTNSGTHTFSAGMESVVERRR